MSEHEDEDLELQAIQRELDDAFATTRPRAGFEGELWTRIQANRPAPQRLRGAVGSFLAEILAVPRVPAAAVATVLVVVLGVGLLALGGAGRHATTGAGSALAPQQLSQPGASRNNNGSAAVAQYGQFGRLPSPHFAYPVPSAAAGGLVTPYTGPAIYTWTGQTTVGVSAAPVFRYREPSVGTADQFASSLGATLLARQAGFLGEYQTADYTLKVRGTNVSAPAYFILSAPNMPPIDTAGESPFDLAVLFLANHGLFPLWPYSTDVAQGPNGQTTVKLLREFGVPGYGDAFLVDANGAREGIEVDLDVDRPVLISGPLPLETDQANYPIVSADQAVQPLLSAGSTAPPGSPTVDLNKVELVYVLVAYGDRSYYEPAYLFSGTFKQGSGTFQKQVILPAVDPSQLCMNRTGTCQSS